MSVLTNDERLNLKKMITESDCDDNTDNIRRLKHSVLMRDDIRKLDTLKNTHSDMKNNDNDQFSLICQNECQFLYTNYTDIFNKLVKDELDLTIMTKLLTVLKLIEDSNVDQHEGSVMVGKILKELYVDSAVQQQKKREDIEKKRKKRKGIPTKKLSWRKSDWGI